jgi:hypothetical protein
MKGGRTPLHVAAKKGQEDSVELLKVGDEQIALLRT